MSAFPAKEFYDAIANKYDWLFSSREKIMDNEAGLFLPVFDTYRVQSVLDCSCGNGLQAISLAKRGYAVDGGDISENMISEAQRLAQATGVSVHFKQSDFRKLHDNFPQTYDCVLSWGNSIPHLMNDADIAKTLNNIYACTKLGGIALIDMRNYDWMLDTRVRFLPMRIHDIRDDFRYSILYVFDYLPGVIRFNLVYLIENMKTGEKHMESESVDYNPIKKADFLCALHNAGFKNVEVNESDRSISYLAVK
ncbi:MAG: class I SAM-dependent methyltransferase [Oscillospiraceae bacterium]|nr:class I SAM-dependent methyltransferase [Oscillospiraceae bacterium]